MPLFPALPRCCRSVFVVFLLCPSLCNVNPCCPNYSPRHPLSTSQPLLLLSCARLWHSFLCPLTIVFRIENKPNSLRSTFFSLFLVDPVCGHFVDTFFMYWDCVHKRCDTNNGSCRSCNNLLGTCARVPHSLAVTLYGSRLACRITSEAVVPSHWHTAVV